MHALTRDKFHWCAFYPETTNQEIESVNSVLEPLEDIVDLIAERCPLMVRRLIPLSWIRLTRNSVNSWTETMSGSTAHSPHHTEQIIDLLFVDSSIGLVSPSRDLLGNGSRKSLCLEGSLDSLQACRRTACSDWCLWWLLGWVKISFLRGETKGKSTSSSISLAYLDGLSHFGAIRIISQGWSLCNVSITRTSVTNGGCICVHPLPLDRPWPLGGRPWGETNTVNLLLGRIANRSTLGVSQMIVSRTDTGCIRHVLE